MILECHGFHPESSSSIHCAQMFMITEANIVILILSVLRFLLSKRRPSCGTCDVCHPKILFTVKFFIGVNVYLKLLDQYLRFYKFSVELNFTGICLNDNLVGLESFVVWGDLC